MTKEEIEKAACNYIDNKIDSDVFYDAFIARADCRQAEIDELKDMVVKLNEEIYEMSENPNYRNHKMQAEIDELVEAFKYMFSNWKDDSYNEYFIIKLLKKYEK